MLISQQITLCGLLFRYFHYHDRFAISQKGANGYGRWRNGISALQRFVRRLCRPVDGFAILSLLLAVPLIVPFLGEGLPATADAEIHLHRMMSALVNLDAGYGYPRWTPYLHHGFGYPIHNFYAPGVHIIGALIMQATSANPVQVIKFLQIGATLLYPLGAYLFARRFASRPAALVAAAAYTLAPFRFHELWTQTNLSQFVAMSLIPFLFTALLPSPSDRPRRAAWIALLFAAIILAHHPTGFMTAVAAGGYAIMTGWRSIRHWAIHLGGLALGLCIASVFLIPALAELQFVQIAAVQQGALSSAANLLPLTTLISPTLAVDLARINTPSFLSIGTPQVGLALLGVLTIAFRRFPRVLKIQVAFGTVTLAVCIVLMIPSSASFWSAIPIANLLVFPWRLLGIAALAVLPAAAALVDLVPPRWRVGVACGVIAVLFALALPMRYAPLSLLPSQAPTPAGAIRYEMETGNMGLTSGNEYLPRWAEERPLRVTLSDHETLVWSVGVWSDSLPAGATVTPVADCARGTVCYTVSSPQAFAFMFKQMYFPGWFAQVDGATVETYPLGVNGLLSLNLSAGRHRLTLRYAGTPVQHASEALSLVGLVLCAGLFLVSLRPTAQVVAPATVQPRPVKRVWVVLPLVAVFVWIAYDTFLSAAYADLFHPRSTFNTLPAQHRVSYVFGDKVELVGYDLDRERAAPGETLSGVLYWRRIGTIESVARLHYEIKLTSANAVQELGSVVAINLADISSKQWRLDGYAVERFTVPISADAPPYTAELRLLVEDGVSNPKSVLLADGSGSDAILTRVSITGDDRRFDVLTPMNARFGEALTLSGYALTRPDANTVCLRLRWVVSSPPERDYTLMLHLLDAGGAALHIADRPPLDGLYPIGQWLPGQTLDDEHCVPQFDGAVAVMIALYDSESMDRLPITLTTGNLNMQDHTLIIPLAGEGHSP